MATGVLRFWPADSGRAEYAVISLAGRVVRQVPLSGPARLLRVRVPGGTAVFRIREGRIRLLPLPRNLSPTEESSREGYIGLPGESIVCLPVRLTAVIRGGEIDAVIR